MANEDRQEIKRDKSKETRSKEISRMISEGGLGAHSHYYYTDKSLAEKAKKEAKKEARSKEISRMIAEGGLGSHSHYYYNDDLKDKEEK